MHKYNAILLRNRIEIISSWLIDLNFPLPIDIYHLPSPYNFLKIVSRSIQEKIENNRTTTALKTFFLQSPIFRDRHSYMHSNKAFGRLSNDGKLHDDKAFRRSAARPITTPTTTIFSRARWTLNDRIWTIPGFSICGRQVCTNGFLPGGNSFESKSNRWLFRFSYRIVFTFLNRCYYFAHDSLHTPFHFFFFLEWKRIRYIF